ncbi:DUF805 domain-containing protein [Kribbella deserti]|uniref:DUF805 domain-containing protein n=1 Tax=Kribbella deserti TaxID=1926257 RepID=A0ABV6QFT0_9ACTN
MRWYVEVIKKYAIFSGRARRREFWMFTLVDIVISFVIVGADELIGTEYALGTDEVFGGGLLVTLYGLAVLVPTITVTFRRLHDVDRTGWWILLALVPVLGWIVLLVFMVTNGTPGNNRYGPDPKLSEHPYVPTA